MAKRIERWWLDTGSGAGHAARVWVYDEPEQTPTPPAGTAAEDATPLSKGIAE
ncbi:hypothetical protein ACWGKQ_46140 [Streptomyces sp. NPDC054770]